jgi:hypothetical protein
MWGQWREDRPAAEGRGVSFIDHELHERFGSQKEHVIPEARVSELSGIYYRDQWQPDPG